MKSREDSVSIRSDEQSLDLDCRIMKPKFKQPDYDTYQTETSTSVYKRIMEIKSSSSEYKFKTCHEAVPSTKQYGCVRKFSDCQLQESNEEKYRNNQFINQNFDNILGKDKTRKKKSKKGSLYSIQSQSQSPISNKNQQNQLQETSSKKSQKSISKSSTVNLPKKGMYNSQEKKIGHTLDHQPIRVQQRTNQLNHHVDQFQNPIQEKITIGQLNRYSLNDNKIGQMYRNTNHFLLTASQPKSILKSKSVCSESSNGENSSKYKSMKSSIFKKVTFESIKGQNNMKQSLHNQQQLIIIQ
ncbi:unnamed protein product (macronuclear) [Paramecium tetraurelia]|uniref:Uncharacterized protein n=1 Tax=Paramecium tetraurelia TaxID=5888 RepID=A0BVX5_PARTE|nr:uncharacterized protein GSPATT00032544001 [Paramecium tetraurelia]CAK62692.1 unnamed protein product [Paramecium tetraurelia]|eukprot:XP_001430090.1 hypothetical protein (macronuclear) [Paramecium tetraurelia strain d4-2]